MRKEGLEPPYPFGYQILSLARLPVPPLSRLFSLPRHALLRRGLVPARSIFGRTFARLAARTLLMINSFTGPLDEAIELIARLAGTGLT